MSSRDSVWGINVNDEYVLITGGDEQVSLPLDEPLCTSDLTLHEARMIFFCSHLEMTISDYGNLLGLSTRGFRWVTDSVEVEAEMTFSHFLAVCSRPDKTITLHYASA